MKKLFASLMAATMVAGMSVSAFAYCDKEGNTPLASGNKVAESTVGAPTPNVYDLEDDFGFGKVILKKDATATTVYGGDKLYAPILVDVKSVEDDDDVAKNVNEKEYFYATKASEVKDLKASVKETQAKGSIKSVEIVKDDAVKFGAKGSGKIYGIKIVLNDYFKDEKDMEFDLTLKEKGKEMLKVEDIFFRLGQDDDNSTLKGEAAKNSDGNYYTKAAELAKHTDNKWYAKTDGAYAHAFVDENGKVTVDGTAAGVVLAKDVNDGYGFGYDAKFKKSPQRLELTVGKDTKLVTLDEVDRTKFGLEKADNNEIKELYMETADGEMIVEGKLSDQDALFLEFKTEATDFQKAVMVENSDAEVDTFVWSAHPTFDFIMDVRVPVEDDRDNFLYEVIDGKLVEVKTELSEDGDELTFETKTLGEYLLSDKQLTAEKAEAAVAEKGEAKEEAAKEDGVKENSETGAAIAVATVIALF